MSALVAEGIVSEDAVQQLGAKNIHSAEDLLFFTCSNFHDVSLRTGISADELERIVKGVSRKLGSLPQCARSFTLAASRTGRRGCPCPHSTLIRILHSSLTLTGWSPAWQ